MASVASLTSLMEDTEYTSSFNGEEELLLIQQHLSPESLSSSSSKLCDYLSSVSLNDTFDYLQELGLDDIFTFYHIEEKELEQLCHQIKSLHADFDFIKKLKFKAAIRNLQKSNTPSTKYSNHSHPINDMIAVTEKERECIENIENTINKIENIQTFYEQYITNDIEINVNNIKQEIHSRFKRIIKSLNKTQRNLLNTVKHSLSVLKSHGFYCCLC